MSGQNNFKRFIRINPTLCQGIEECLDECEQNSSFQCCYEFCPTNAIGPISLQEFKATLLYAKSCSGCGKCIKICRNKAIQIAQ